MYALVSLLAVAGVASMAWLGALHPDGRYLVAGAAPAVAALACLAGVAWKVLRWAGSPVPFRIPVTCGQQASFAWLRPARLDNPSTLRGVLGRMALEVLLFRSLLRNAHAEQRGERLVYRDAIALWLAALAFHYALLAVALRHLRFVTEPVPGLISALAAVDAFFQVGVPALYASDVVLLLALTYLVGRRLGDVRMRYLSIFGDYFFPILILGVAATGVLMRQVVRVDAVAVKELAMGIVTFSAPNVAASLHPLFFVHVALASVLVGSLPFSKLAHMAGVFLSPTRNLANNSRARRHVNPWDHPVAVHSYAAWEQEFHDKLVASGLPVEEHEDHV